MTEKLYYQDSYNFSFEANIYQIINGDKIAVILDRTCFFPEGGGQKSDIGYIGNSFVYDVQEIDGIIYHYVKDLSDLECNKIYNCKIDGNIRFSRMQAHTGEHILSGLAYKYFGAENVGFHMDETQLMTVDFDLPLSPEQVSFLENESNRCIYENHPVKSEIYTVEDAKNLRYRSKIEFSDYIRIVSISDVDMCACCAPHLNCTAQVGLLKILSCISHRGGVRLSLICGIAAFNDYKDKFKQILNISSMICSPHDKTDAGVEQLISQNKDIRKKISDQKERLFNFICDSVTYEDFIIMSFNDFNAEELRLLSNKLSSKSQYGVFLFTGNDYNGYSYCFNSDIINSSDFLREMKASINATGGGKGNIIQGKIQCDKQSILDFLNEKRNNYENEKKETS